jgi:hypothetical protein
LKGCFGNFPGQADEVKSPPRWLKLADNLNWRELAIHAAEFNQVRCIGRSYAEEVRFTGAYFYLEDSARNDPYYQSIQQYVAGLAGKSPDQFLSWDNTGFNPRRESPGGRIYIGEDCRDRLHFDCIGLVDWVLTKTFDMPFDCGIGQFHSGSGGTNVDTYQGLPAQSDLRAGDILVSNPSHIALVTGSCELVHACGERWGVRRTPLSFGEIPYTRYNAVCRIKRSFLRERGWLPRRPAN